MHPYVTFQRNDEQWCESLAEHADAALLARAPSPQRQDSRSHAPATRTPVVEHAHIAILPLRHSAGCEAPVAGRFPGSALHEPSDGYVPLGAQGARVQGWKKAPLPQGPGLFVPPENGQHGTCAFLDAHTSTPHNTRDPARYAHAWEGVFAVRPLSRNDRSPQPTAQHAHFPEGVREKESAEGEREHGG